MLDGAATDRRWVVHRTLVVIACVCCALVGASFLMFARDQVAGASKHQQTEIASSAQTTPGVAPEPTHHGQPRQFIDDAAHALTSPFASIVDTNSDWAKRAVPALIAFLLYGVGLGYLARYSRGRA